MQWKFLYRMILIEFVIVQQPLHNILQQSEFLEFHQIICLTAVGE